MMERMSAEREKALIRAAQQSSDEGAVEELIHAHMGLIRSAAMRFQVPNLWLEELVQAGCVGWLQAIQRYVPSSGNRLAAYALPWALGEMKRAVRRMTHEGGIVLSLENAFDGQAEGRCIEETIGCETISFERLDLSLAIERLSKAERRLLYLRFFRDKTQKETAIILNKSQAQISRMEKGIINILRMQLT